MQKGTTASGAFPSIPTRDVLTELLREGAQQLFVTAIEVKMADWIESRVHLR